MLFLKFLFINNPEKKYYRFPKSIQQHNCYNSNFVFKKGFLSTKSAYIRMISEDHVTLKTGVMKLKIQRCVTEINYILQYIKMKNSYFKL